MNESAKSTSTTTIPLLPAPGIKGRSNVPLWIGVLVITFIVGVWTAWNAYISYNNAMQLEYRTLEVHARQREALVSGALRSVDLMMGSIIEDLRDHPHMSAADQNLLLKSYLRQLPEIRSLLITDANGRIQVHTKDEKAVGFDAANREYFKTHQEAPEKDDFHISIPFKTRSGIIATTQSRAIRDRNGRFLGVVAATLDAPFFDEALKLNVSEPEMQAALINRNGDILNEVPSSADIGKNLQGGIAYTEHSQSGKTTTRHLNITKLEKIKKLSVFHNVPHAPLTVIVSRDYDRVIAGWLQIPDESDHRSGVKPTAIPI